MGVTSIGFTRAAVRKNQARSSQRGLGLPQAWETPALGASPSLGCLKSASCIREPSTALKVLERGRQRREGTTRFSQSQT